MKTTPKYKIEQIIKNKIDVKSGCFTFGQRIGLGKILTSNDSNELKFEKVFYCLHNYRPYPNEYNQLMDYYTEILIGFKYWIDLENSLLKFKSAEEVEQIRISDLTHEQQAVSNKFLGVGSLINILARKYNVEPADVLNWDYEKVFNILLADLDNYKHELMTSISN